MKKSILFLLLFIINITVNAQEEAGPQIHEMYFTNLDGEKISGTVNPDFGMVYLVISSSNSIGKKALITMDEDEEYIYKKKFLGEGSSIEITINDDIHKVEFTIYNPRNKKHVKKRKKVEGFKKAKDAKG